MGAFLCSWVTRRSPGVRLRNGVTLLQLVSPTLVEYKPTATRISRTNKLRRYRIHPCLLGNTTTKQRTCLPAPSCTSSPYTSSAAQTNKLMLLQHLFILLRVMDMVSRWQGRPEGVPPPSTFCHKQTNKNLRCGNRKGLRGRNDQTHHRMGPKTMESIPPSKRNTQADIQLRTRQTNHQQETDGCIQIKHNPEHQPSRMSSKSTAYVPPKTASTPTKANTQTCSYLDFNQFLIRRITRNICLRLRIKQIQILTCREQDIR